MKYPVLAAGIALLAGTVLSIAGRAQTPAPAVVPPSGMSASFRYTTSVHTPKGTHNSSGTISVKHTQGRSVLLTVKTDSGQTKSIPLTMGTDGTIVPSSSGPAPTATTQPDAAARTFMGQVSVAAKVGIAARKNAQATTFNVPINLTPVGTGSPVPVQLRMTATQTGNMTQFKGTASGQTETVLPQNGQTDPQAVAASAGADAMMHGVTPAGRFAVGAAVHRRVEQNQKKNGGKPVSDAMSLTSTVQFSSGRIQTVSGDQDDALKVGPATVHVRSSWSFTRNGP